MFVFMHPVLRGFFSGVVILLVLGLIAGLILHFTRIPETFTPLMMLFILCLSAFMGGFKAARLAGARGLIIGLEIGLLFILLVLAFALVFKPGLFTWPAVLVKLGLMGLAGAGGGTLGIAFAKE